MTHKEIYKFLANTKVYVNGKSKEIQEKLFSLGYKWSYECTEVKCTEYPFLFIYTYNMLFTKSDDMWYFSNHVNREISAEEILSLEITEPIYLPFKNKEECWQEMLKHEPFGWVTDKDSDTNCNIGFIGNNAAGFFDGRFINFVKLFSEFTFTDGTPFGIKEG